MGQPNNEPVAKVQEEVCATVCGSLSRRDVLAGGVAIASMVAVGCDAGGSNAADIPPTPRLPEPAGFV